MSRLAQLEQKLEAYRKLHTSELEEIARGIAELREEMHALARAVQFTSTDGSNPSSVAPALASLGKTGQDERQVQDVGGHPGKEAEIGRGRSQPQGNGRPAPELGKL